MCVLPVSALRKTMVRAHRQAWAWQDEWFGLTMDDIREIERQTQVALQKKMGDGNDDDDDGSVERSISEVDNSKHSTQFQSIEKTEETPMFPKKLQSPPQLKEHPPSIDSSDGEEDEPITASSTIRKESGQLSLHSKYGSKGALHSPGGSTHSFDLQVSFDAVFRRQFNFCGCFPVIFLLIH